LLAALLLFCVIIRYDQLFWSAVISAAHLGWKVEPEIASWLARLQLNRGSASRGAGIRDVQLETYRGAQLTVLKVSATGISDLRFRHHPGMVSVVIATCGRFQGVAAGRSFAAVLNQVSCVLLPDDPLALTATSDVMAALVIQLSLQSLWDACRRQGVAQPDLRLLLDALTGQEALLMACSERLLQLARRPEGEARSTLALPLEASVLGAMASVLVGRDQLPHGCAQDAHVLHVEQAMAYMESHMAEMIALQDLCQACYISARTLQVSFQRVRGCTPLQALQEIRLASLRKHLLKRMDLREACVLVGLPPTGRMAANYKRLFGELPSRTRQRAGWVINPVDGLRAPVEDCDGRCSDNQPRAEAW
jgi:AraC-like DNA-binding protein